MLLDIVVDGTLEHLFDLLTFNLVFPIIVEIRPIWIREGLLKKLVRNIIFV